MTTHSCSSLRCVRACVAYAELSSCLSVCLSRHTPSDPSPPGRDGGLDKSRSRSLRQRGGGFRSIGSQRTGKCPRFLARGGGNRFPVLPRLAGKVAQNANHHFRRRIENRRADLRPFPPRAICPLGPGLGGWQKAKGLRGYPGRHDGLPGAGLRCTFAQRGWFGGFHDGSVMLRSQSEQSEPWTYACTADMRARG